MPDQHPTQSRRARRKNMCPNRGCAEHAKPTGLLGGCGECGARLVPYLPQFVEPTTEQLARFAAEVLKPDWIVGPVNVQILTRLLDGDPDTRARVRSQHREFQQQLYNEANR